VLIGRDAEIAQIGLLLEDARQGTSGALVLRGEAGIGKTTLLDEAVVRAAGFRVLRAVGVESEEEIAFAGLQQLLRPVMPLLSEVPAHQAHALAIALTLDDGPPPERLLVSAGALSLFAAASEERPLLCVVDDAHWLDDASAGTLTFVARRLQVESIAMLFAAREPERAMFETVGLADLRVGGLDAEAATTLVTAGAPDLAPGAANQLVALTRGNPLALLELPRSLEPDQRAGIVPIDEPLPVGREIERAFSERARLLPQDTRRALLLAAAGSPADEGAVWLAFEREGLGEDAVAAAGSSGLLVRDRLEFSHPLVRSAVYQAARAKDRRSAHATLAATTTAPDRRAWHLAAATTGPDEEVASALESAADAARRRGGVTAEAKALERAADLTLDSEARARRLLRAAFASEAAGWLEAADRMLADVAALTNDRVLHAEAVARRSYLVADRGEFERAFALSIDEAAHAPPHQAGHALSLGALMALTHLLDIDAAVEIAERAWQLDGAGDDGDLHVLENLCRTWILAGRRDDARSLVARSLGRVDATTELAVNFGTDLMYLEDYARAREILERAVVEARQAGALGFLSYALDQFAKLETRAGSPRIAYALELESLRINEASGPDVAVAASTAWLALLEAMLGRPESHSHGNRALEIASGIGDVYNVVRARAALGIESLAGGDSKQAVEWLEPAVASVVGGGVREPNFFRLDGDLVESLVRLGRADDARQHLDRLDRQALETGGMWARAVAARCHAMLADDNDLQERFENALELHEHDPSALEKARTQLCYGERLRRARRRREARDVLRSSLETFEALETRPWADRARAELLATGEHASRREPGAAERLTPQELQIATHVAEGLTNRDVAARLFLSPKTIEFHLTAVYRKLNVRSRSELIRLFAVDAPERLPVS
jgi:DNA-binding CsgD family transcriptional regulator